MDNKNSLVMSTLIAVAGVAVGAGSVLYVQSSAAFSGTDPRAAVEAENPRVLRTYSRSDVRRREAGFFETSSYTDNEEPVHAAATSNHEYTVDELTERCLDLNITRRRLSLCLQNARNGLRYQLRQIDR